MELNPWKIFSICIYIGFHKLNPLRTSPHSGERRRWLPNKSDVITESQIPGKSIRAWTWRRTGVREMEGKMEGEMEGGRDGGLRKWMGEIEGLWMTSVSCSMVLTDWTKTNGLKRGAESWKWHERRLSVINRCRLHLLFILLTPLSSLHYRRVTP